MRSFRCAPWKRLRIFEGILGIFQDAHFSKLVRIFEGRAHLRSGALALDPVPTTRKVAQAAASASGGLFGLALKTDFIEDFFAAGARHTWPFRVQAGRARRKRKSRALGLARLRLGEIYSLWLYRFSVFVPVLCTLLPFRSMAKVF